MEDKILWRKSLPNGAEMLAFKVGQSWTIAISSQDSVGMTLAEKVYDNKIVLSYTRVKDIKNHVSTKEYEQGVRELVSYTIIHDVVNS